MSVDVRLTYACPHLAEEEPVVLGEDRRSLATSQYVAGMPTRILVNDEIWVPPAGLSIPAQLTGATSGPFQIANCGQDFIVSSSAETVSMTLPTTTIGSRLTADEFLRLFRPLTDQILVENIGGFLVFTDMAQVGPSSIIQVEGSAAGSLGFNQQLGTRGKDLYPGWNFYTPPNQVSKRYPRFVSPVWTNPQWKVSYPMAPDRCLRCQATWIENDYRFATTGDVILIRNENLLHQASLKILLTTQGSNPYFKEYGTKLRSRIGAKAVGAVSTAINQEVRSTLERYQNWQKVQGKYQRVSNKEKLYSILNVRTIPKPDDPTTFLIDVTVQNASADPINLTVLYTVPGVVARLIQDGQILSQIGDKGAGFFPLPPPQPSAKQPGPAYLVPPRPQLTSNDSGEGQ